MTELLGTIIHNYRLLDYIGAGGHGKVYKAQNLDNNQLIALKIMLEEHNDDTILIQRLHQEADIVRDLRHPHIVPLIEFWDDDDGVCIATPWVEGGDLRQFIETRTKLTPDEVRPLLNQICSALDAAHAARIVHRDIKPENILIDTEENVFLTDFGFAKRQDISIFETSEGAIVGSPNYLSPEQIKGETVGSYTDIHTLGILIYEMLTGKHPYVHLKSRIQLVVRLVNDMLPAIVSDDIAKNQLDEINALITRCTAKKPEDRYLTASSVAYHFAQIITN